MAVARLHAGMGHELGVAGAPLVELELGPGGEGAGLEAATHPGLERLQVLECRGAHVVLGRGAGRDDVGSVSTLGDDPVHLVLAPELLSQQPDPDLGHRQGVGRVDARLREGRGVGLPPGVVHVEVGHGETRHLDQLGRSRMDHHRRVDAGEGATLEHVDLASAALLGRGADHLDRDAEVVGEGRQGQPGPDGRGRDDVVPAGVADTRKGVVLGAHGDDHRPAPGGGDQGGGEVAHAVLDLEAAGGERLTDPGGRPLLLEGQLGVGVDGVAQVEEAREVGVQLALDEGLSIHRSVLPPRRHGRPLPSSASRSRRSRRRARPRRRPPP